MLRKTLVINADDLGFAPGVNRGILEAHHQGVLSSASMMVNTPAFSAAAEMVHARAPRLGVGLHLNLISGHPLAETATLADPRTGLFFSLGELSRRAIAGRILSSDVRRECDAQLSALRAAGITPTHLDSHRHTHALPGILHAVVASARAAHVPVIRRPLDRPTPSDPVASAKMLVIHAAWRAAVRALIPPDRALIERSPAFRGIALQGKPDVQQRLLRLLHRLPEGITELMVHPGYDDAVLAAQDPYRAHRERELAALCSAPVRERLMRGDIRLVRFDEL